MEIAEWWSKPARTLRKNAQSVTLRATGPETESVNQPSRVGTSGTRPGEVRMPTTLQKFGGLRSEPPMSLPSASGTMPQASATAPPPVLPPQVLVKSYGLRVAPNTGLNVCEPRPNSGTFVLPITIPPAAFSRCTTRQSKSGTKSRCSGEPNVVRIPAVSCKSLTPTGNPCNGPSNFPFAKDSSAAAACAINCSSATKVTIALTLELTRPICFKCADITSRAESFFSRINFAMSTARIKQISADEPEVLAKDGDVVEVGPASIEFASADLAESSGVTAADTATFVPNFNASRRLIVFISSSHQAEEQYHTPCSGRSLDRSSNSRKLAGNKQLLGEGNRLFCLRRIIQFAAREIARPAALPRELGEHLLQQSIHVFSNCRMLRKKQMSIARLT